MHLSSKVSIPVSLLLFVSICIYSAGIPSAHSWGGGTHRFIAQNAIDIMPDNFDWFFSTYSSTIVTYSTLPDQWKGRDRYEQYRHYYHINYPHDESDYSNGVLPWAVEDNFNTFVQYLKEKDWDNAAQLAGVIAHYIGDASQPLHATSDFDPGGNHSAYESTVTAHLDEINMDTTGFAPYQLDNVFSSTNQLLKDSYSYTVDLNTYLDQEALWNDWIQTTTENRLQSGAQMLADVWYTAAVQAGISQQPASTSLSTTSPNRAPYVIGVVLAIALVGVLLVLYRRRS